MHTNLAPEKPSTELFLETVVTREPCGKHRAHRGTPCWILEGVSGFLLQGVCNKRARKAGFTHRISDKSLRLNRTPKR